MYTAMLLALLGCGRDEAPEEPAGLEADADTDTDTDADSDTDADADADLGNVSTPDPSDCYAVQSVDYGDDGIVDGEILEVYDPALTGLLVWSEHDDPLNGWVDRTETWVWDPTSLLKLAHEEDADGDGDLDFTETFSWNEKGDPLAYWRDEDGDGDLDRITTYTYDDLGRLVTEVYDRDADGFPEEVITHLYDEQGLRWRIDNDLDGDGVTDMVVLYFFDEQGRWIRQQQDYDLDGATDLSIDVVRTDGPPNVERREIDIADDGIVDAVWQTTTDDAGRLLAYATDDDNDGLWEYSVIQTWDPAGVLLTEEIWDQYVGLLRVVHSYDAQLRQIETWSILDDGPEGADPSTELHTWVFGGACP